MWAPHLNPNSKHNYEAGIDTDPLGVLWFWFDLIVLFNMDSLNKTRSLFDIKVHEAKKALINDIGWVNRVHLTVLVSDENIYILGIS